MYTSFYNLHVKPFQISSDPKFLWLGEKHKEALATLKYGVLDNKGFLLLTGDVGTGKTTIINTLIESLSDDVIYAFVADPSLSKLDFFNYIASSFGINQEFLTKGSFLVGFRKFLFDANEENKKVLLIIDESQLLTQDLLEEIRLLSNIEKTDTKLINIFFVGQNEFNEIVSKEQNRAVRQRLTLNYNIDPLTPDETQKYIDHRLEVAGVKKTIFDLSAVQEIFMYSGGFPRRINVICDHALLSGYVNGSAMITAQIVQECAKELKIPAYVQNRDINGFGNSRSKPLSPVQSRNQFGNHSNIQSKPVALKSRITQKKKNKIGNTIMLIIAILLFSLICWWMLFPAGFQLFLSNTYNQIDLFKNRTSKPPLDLSSTVQLSDAVENIGKFYKIDKINDQAQDLVNIDTKTQPAMDSYQIGKPHQGKSESLQNIKKVQNPEPIVQNDSEQGENSKELSEDRPGQPGVPVAQVESTQDTQYNPLDQKLERKKKLPLPEKAVVIRFQYDNHDFTQEGLKKIKEFADIIAMHPDTKILIAGHSDSNGNEQYNQQLSEFRAHIVRSFLLGRGVMVKQIIVKGFGSINPSEVNNTAWGRMMNRRVEIEIVE